MSLFFSSMIQFLDLPDGIPNMEVDLRRDEHEMFVSGRGECAGVKEYEHHFLIITDQERDKGYYT